MNIRLSKSVKTVNTVLLLSIITCNISCLPHKPQFEGVPFKKHTSFEKTGYSKEHIDSLHTYISQNMTTTGMLILKDGKILLEYGDVRDLGYIASCRKSILSILYGEYVENGTIDLNQTIGEIGIDEGNDLFGPFASVSNNIMQIPILIVIGII